MKRVLVKTINTKVLVVDDNEVNLLVAKATLERYDISVEAVQSGAEALEKLESTAFDLVILDCIMPEMDGHETAKRIRALSNSRSKTPITAYTANNADDVRAEFEDVGVTDVLIKPLDTVELTKVLLKYLPTEKLLNKDDVIAELNALGNGVVEEETTAQTPLQKLLEKIPELDYVTGLHYTAGSEESYIKILSAASDSMRNIAVNIAFFARNLALKMVPSPFAENDISDFSYGLNELRIDTHSLKGMCASIGFDSLSKASAEFEQMVKAEKDFTEVLPQLCEYSNKLVEIGNELLNAVNTYKAQNASAEDETYIPLPDDQYDRLWSDTLEHVKRFEINEIHDGLERLLTATQDSSMRINLKLALDAAACFDYGKVSEILGSRSA